VDSIASSAGISDLKGQVRAHAWPTCDLLILPRLTLINVGPAASASPTAGTKTPTEAQVAAVKEFMKAGKPGPVLLWPDQRAGAAEDDAVHERGGPDGLDTETGKLGIKLAKQTVLFTRGEQSRSRSGRGGLVVMGR